MYSSVSKMKSDRKPPLATSPMRLRTRRVLRPSNSCLLQTPTATGSLTESKKPVCSQDIEESELRPEYRTISCELRNLSKMVWEELGKTKSENSAFESVNSSTLFERGRFYDEYSARRNERLKRKKGVTADDGKASVYVYNLGVTVESAKKSGSKKRESLRKSVSAAYSVDPRSSDISGPLSSASDLPRANSLSTEAKSSGNSTTSVAASFSSNPIKLLTSLSTQDDPSGISATLDAASVLLCATSLSTEPTSSGISKASVASATPRIVATSDTADVSSIPTKMLLLFSSGFSSRFSSRLGSMPKMPILSMSSSKDDIVDLSSAITVEMLELDLT
ncbi:uncharacterized protein G2W53_011820 [Senna tora]|uniref:Uncharacterized protein n=1 Tax=Senna tora TaxID=362788 RepID=A0A834TWR1_9FABA|nr:uncharacterized protein G2W53_011820 [Senna tora]